MQVTSIRVSFLREKQPAQFEKAQPAVEFAAVLDEGEDHVSAARTLMTDATAIVYAGIGYKVPAKVAKALKTGEAPAEVVVEVKTEEVAEETPEAEATEEAPKATEEAPKKARGRPKGSKNTAVKKGSKADKAAQAESEAAAATDDGLPPADDDEPQIRTNPEDRVDPENTDDGLPPEDDTGEEEFTAKSLHNLIHESIKDKKLSVPDAKSILASFKVARAQDLTDDQVIKGRAMLEELIAARTA